MKAMTSRAWRIRVASYALKIRVAIPPIPELDSLLERLGEEQDPKLVAREEVEAVVVTHTKALKLGGTTPKSATKENVEGVVASIMRLTIGPCMADVRSYIASGRSDQWSGPSGSNGEFPAGRPESGKPSTDAFRTFYSGLWGVEGHTDMNMAPLVPRSTGDVLRELTP